MAENNAADANNTVHAAVLEALAAINGAAKKDQELHVNKFRRQHDVAGAQRIVDFLEQQQEQHPGAVTRLRISFYEHISLEAVEIFRAFFARTMLVKISLVGDVGGNEIGGRLVSGLHGNTSVTQLALCNMGLSGAAGGEHLASLLRNNSHLQHLICVALPLGAQGARTFQPALMMAAESETTNHHHNKLYTLAMVDCGIGNEGTRLIVDALQDNKSITILSLEENRITSDGLPHLTRLLRQNSSIKVIDLESNPGLLSHPENTRLFSNALSQNNKTLISLRVSQCQSPGHAVVALFRAAMTNKVLVELNVFDSVRLQGQDIESILAIIPKLKNMLRLHVNLDFTSESVLSSIHRNESLEKLYTGENRLEITNNGNAGPLADISERNLLISKANVLLEHAPDKVVIAWAKAMERLTRDSRGATAAYKILREQLVMWWAPSSSSSSSSNATTKATCTNNSATTATAPVITAKSNGKHSHSHSQPPVESDAGETLLLAQSSSSSSDPKRKRPRYS